MSSSPEVEINVRDYYPVRDRVRAKNNKQELDADLFTVFIKHLAISSDTSQITLDADLKGLVKRGQKDAATLYRNANTTETHRQKLIELLVPADKREDFKFKRSNTAGDVKLYDCIKQLHHAGYRSGPRQIKLDDSLFKVLEKHLTASKANATKETLIATITTLQHEFVLKAEKASAFSLYRNANTTEAHRQKLIELLVPKDKKERFQFQPSNAVGDYKLYDCMKQLNQAGFGNGHLEDFRHLMARVKGNSSRFSFLSGYGTGHLEDFRRQIHGVHYKSNRWALGFLASIGTALSFGYFHLNPDKLLIVEQALEHTAPSLFERGFDRLTHHIFPIVKNFLGKTFSVLKNIPLLLVLWTVFQIPWQIGKTWFNDDFKAPWKRFQKFMASILPPILSITAYGICYMANGVFTFPAVAFFVAASFVDVIDNAITLYLLSQKQQERNTPNTRPEKTASDRLNKTQLKALIQALKEQRVEDQIALRQQERYDRTWRTAPVKFVAAIFITITVALWCYFPPSFFVMLSCVAFISLVGFTKNARLAKIHTDSTEQLQLDLRTLYQDTKDELRPYREALDALNTCHQQRRAKLEQQRLPSGESLVFSQVDSTEGQAHLSSLGAWRNSPPLDGTKRPHALDYVSSSGSDNDDADQHGVDSDQSSEYSATFD
jgi:hypothetical protein